MRMDAHRRIVVMLPAALLWFAGCKGPQVLPPSGTHAPTDPASVELYQKQPAKYEKLGVVQITKNLNWPKEGNDVSPAVEEMKARAAGMGANGLLLMVDPDVGANVRILGTYKGNSYQFPIDRSPPTWAAATAVFVIEK